MGELRIDARIVQTGRLPRPAPQREAHLAEEASHKFGRNRESLSAELIGERVGRSRSPENLGGRLGPASGPEERGHCPEKPFLLFDCRFVATTWCTLPADRLGTQRQFVHGTNHGGAAHGRGHVYGRPPSPTEQFRGGTEHRPALPSVQMGQHGLEEPPQLLGCHLNRG